MFKKIVLGSVLSLSFFITSCKKKESATAETTAKTDSVKVNTAEKPAGFDVNTIPVSDKDLGAFPYFSIPEWLSDKSTYGGDRNTDTGKLEVYTGKDFYPVEGKVFVKSYDMHDPNDAGKSVWDEYKFVKSFSQHFESLGAKKIYEGKIPTEARDALNKAHNSEDYFYDFGTPQQENTTVYALKQNGKTIFFVITSNSSYGALNVAESGEFVQTVGIIKSDQIQKDLAEKGKSVLHINFDTDKATLKPDGNEAIAEISKVLEADKTLKLDINGYTDNAGDEAHNLKLSKDRANAVVVALVAKGIDKSRLKADGFGANSPISPNDTADGKAQNRRVELVKR